MGPLAFSLPKKLIGLRCNGTASTSLRWASGSWGSPMTQTSIGDRH